MNLIRRAAAQTTDAAAAYVPPNVKAALNWRALPSFACPKCGDRLSKSGAGAECSGGTCSFFITTGKLEEIVGRMRKATPRRYVPRDPDENLANLNAL